MKLSALLRDTVLGRARLVAGRDGLEQDILWVQIIDHPDIVEWVQPGYLLLMTGYHWPSSIRLQQALVRKLRSRGLAGIVLAVPRFLTQFSDDVRKTADTIGLPLLEIPWDIPFHTVTAEIYGQIVAHQQALLARSDAIHRSLTRAAATGSNLEGLARLLAGHLNGIIRFVNKEGLPLGASTADDGRRPASQRHLVWPSHAAGAAALHGEAFESHVPGDTLGGARLGCAVLVHDEARAMIWLERKDSAFTDLDRRAIEHAATVAALHLIQLDAIQQREEQLGYTLFESLLDGSFPNDALSLERARVAGWEPGKPCRLIVAGFRHGAQRSDHALLKGITYWKRRIQHLLQGWAAPALTLVEDSRVYFLLLDTIELNTLWEALGRNPGIALAASRSVDSAGGIATAKMDVTELLPYLVWGQAITFEQVLLPRVLSGDKRASRMFVTARLGPLLRLPRSDALMETLMALCEAGFQLNKTAEHMGIHINTLRYRFVRIQDLLQGSLDDGHFRFELQLALELWNIHKAEWVRELPASLPHTPPNVPATAIPSPALGRALPPNPSPASDLPPAADLPETNPSKT